MELFSNDDYSVLRWSFSIMFDVLSSYDNTFSCSVKSSYFYLLTTDYQPTIARLLANYPAPEACYQIHQICQWPTDSRLAVGHQQKKYELLLPHKNVESQLSETSKIILKLHLSSEKCDFEKSSNFFTDFRGFPGFPVRPKI